MKVGGGPERRWAKPERVGRDREDYKTVGQKSETVFVFSSVDRTSPARPSPRVGAIIKLVSCFMRVGQLQLGGRANTGNEFRALFPLGGGEAVRRWVREQRLAAVSRAAVYRRKPVV